MTFVSEVVEDVEMIAPRYLDGRCVASASPQLNRERMGLRAKAVCFTFTDRTQVARSNRKRLANRAQRDRVGGIQVDVQIHGRRPQGLEIVDAAHSHKTDRVPTRIVA